jgi:hypothetical protein
MRDSVAEANTANSASGDPGANIAGAVVNPTAGGPPTQGTGVLPLSGMPAGSGTGTLSTSGPSGDPTYTWNGGANAATTGMDDNAECFPSACALSSLLWFDTEFPRAPYKPLILGMQRQEYASFVPPPIYFYDPENYVPRNAVPQIHDSRRDFKYQGFIQSKMGGINKFHHLVSDAALDQTGRLMTMLRASLGNFPVTVKNSSGSVSAQFIESFSVPSAFNVDVATPRMHRLQVSVEGIVEGSSLDECINLFIRRIVEEAYHAEQSIGSSASASTTATSQNPAGTTASAGADDNADVLSSNIHVYFRGSRTNTYVITMDSMRQKREQMTSIIKSAIVDDGEVHLKLYLIARKRVLPNLSANKINRLYLQETTGFVEVDRNYNFCFKSNTNARCFSTQPFRSLSTHVFVSAPDVKNLLEVYHNHVSRTAKREQQQQAGGEDSGGFESLPVSETGIEKMLNHQFACLAAEALECFREGEVVNAVEHMIKLQSLLQKKPQDGGDKIPLSYCIRQLASVTQSQAGRLRSIRDAVTAAGKVCSALHTHISNYNAEHAEHNANVDVDTLVDAGKQSQLRKLLRVVCVDMVEAVKEIKYLLLQLLRDKGPVPILCSELSSASKLLYHLLSQLFSDSKGQLLTPCIQTAVDFTSEASINECLLIVPGKLMRLHGQLMHLAGVLQMCESSIAVRILLNMFVHDMRSQLLTSCTVYYRDNFQNNVENKNNRQDMKVIVNSILSEDSSKTFIDAPIPRCVSELCRYVAAIARTHVSHKNRDNKGNDDNDAPDDTESVIDRYDTIASIGMCATLAAPVQPQNASAPFDYSFSFLRRTARAYLCTQLIDTLRFFDNRKFPATLDYVVVTKQIVDAVIQELRTIQNYYHTGNNDMHGMDRHLFVHNNNNNIFNFSLSLAMHSLPTPTSSNDNRQQVQKAEPLPLSQYYPHVVVNSQHRDAAKIQYLEQNMVVTALHEATFLAATTTKRVSGLLLGTIALLPYASLNDLCTVAADTKHMLAHAFQSLRLRLVRPLRVFATVERMTFSALSNAVFHKKSATPSSSSGASTATCAASYLPNQGRSVSGQLNVGLGVFGCDRLLVALGDTQEIYRRAWLLPPICPQTGLNTGQGVAGGRAASNGVFAQLCCGVSAQTAMHWGNSELPGAKGTRSVQHQTPITMGTAVILTVSHPNYQSSVRAEYARVVCLILKHMCARENARTWRVNEILLNSREHVDSASHGEKAGSGVSVWDGRLFVDNETKNFQALQSVR